MNARTRSPHLTLARAALVLAAALPAGLVPAPAGAQAVVTPEPALERVVAERDRVDAPVVSRAVLVNAPDVERLARRWYRSVDGTATLGGGDVVVYARVLPDGTVAEAFVPEAGPHHPALNGLARRLATAMRFAPVGADGATPEPTELGSAGYWVAQRIRFRP